MAGTGLEPKNLFGASILSLPTLDPYQQKLSQRWTLEAKFIEALVCSVHWAQHIQVCPSRLHGTFCAFSLDCEDGHFCRRRVVFHFLRAAPVYVWVTHGDRKSSGLAQFPEGRGREQSANHSVRLGPGRAVSGGQAGSALAFQDCTGSMPLGFV